MIDGDRLRERMEARGMSQAELGRRVGVAQTSIFKLLSGRSINSRYLHKIARELNTTPAYLTGETDDPSSDQPDDTMSSEDRDVVEMLNRLSDRDRAIVRQLIRSLADHTDASPSTPAPTPATLHSPAVGISE